MHDDWDDEGDLVILRQGHHRLPSDWGGGCGDYRAAIIQWTGELMRRWLVVHAIEL